MSLVDCCRLCLKNLTDVLLDEDGHFTIAGDPNLQRMIFDCFQILVSDGEIISKVCSRCNHEVRVVDKIRKRVRKADFEIKQYYASVIVKQEDEFLEEVLNESPKDTELHQPDDQQLDLETGVSEGLGNDDTSCNDNINQHEFIEIEPLFDYDSSLIKRNSSESESEYDEPTSKPTKKRKNVMPMQFFTRKVDSKCYICETDFDTLEALDDHISSHVGSVGQECNICQLPISTVRHLNMHLRRIHFRKGKRFPCEECQKNNVVRDFSSNSLLQTHIKMEHEGIVEIPEKNFICTYCGKSFGRASHLRLHENIHTKAILYKCKQCPFSATSKSGLHRHERIHTNEKPFKCDECDASFNQSNSLHSHKNAKHSNERPFCCEICGVRYKTKYILQNHMRTHAQDGQTGRRRDSATGTLITEREMKCKFCPAVYAWEKFLCQHIVEKHPNENFPMLSCELCEDANKKVFFLSESAKDRHISKHKTSNKTVEKERVCPDCGEVYPTNDLFQRHREKHVEHVCKDCGRSFANSKSQRRHFLTVHLKSRPYKCDKCDSSFGQFTSLTAHMKVHQRPMKIKERSK